MWVLVPETRGPIHCARTAKPQGDQHAAQAVSLRLSAAARLHDGGTR